MKDNKDADFFDKENEKFPVLIQETMISLLKTNISLVPVIGPVINEFLFDLPSRIIHKRLNEFVNELNLKLSKIETDNINKEYLNGDEFYDLTIKIFETATRTSTPQKRKALASVYIGAINGDTELNTDLYFLFAEFISQINSTHIYILHFIQKNEPGLAEIGSYENYFSKFKAHYDNMELDKYEFKYYNTDLESKSLISTGAGLDNFDSSAALIALNSHKDPSVKLTSIGHKFLNHLT